MTAPVPSQRRRLASGCLGAVAALGLALTGCSGSSSPADPSVSTPTGTGGVTSASPSPSPSPSGVRYVPGDPQRIGARVVVHRSVAATPDEKAVAAAWLAYWELTGQAFNTQGAVFGGSSAALDAVATGQAKVYLLGGLSDHVKGHLHTVGTLSVDITSVKVTGATATVTACGLDQSFEVDDKGQTVIPAPGVERLPGTLVRQGGRWLVSQASVLAGGCTYSG